MKFLIDDANIENIKMLYEYYPVAGVTTNPSILAKNKANPLATLEAIRDFIGEDELHIQVLSADSESMVAEAKLLVEKFGVNTYIKVPTNKEGLKTLRKLAEANIKTTATAIYTPTQALLAAASGAAYVAPYVNRIDNLGYDGVQTTLVIEEILVNNNYKTKVLAASFKNSNQILRLAEKGVGAATCSAEVFEKFIDDYNVNLAIEAFINDFNNIDLTKKSWLDYK